MASLPQVAVIRDKYHNYIEKVPPFSDKHYFKAIGNLNSEMLKPGNHLTIITITTITIKFYRCNRK